MQAAAWTTTETWGHRARLTACAARRLLAWRVFPAQWPAPRMSPAAPPAAPSAVAFPHLVYEERIPIARSDAAANRLLEQGKQINVALAAPHFDGIVVAPDSPLSFWRALGRITARRGYRYGMELRGGCIVPALGGGICLLSNALFAMAARLGWTILERHGHSMDAGMAGREPWGLDATVLWPHVDLRIAPKHGAARLRMRAADGELRIAVEAEGNLRSAIQLVSVDEREDASFRHNLIVRTMDGREEVIAENDKRVLRGAEPRRTCLSCGETSCKARVVLPRR
jgi:vancomycin resistance protein VanW